MASQADWAPQKCSSFYTISAVEILESSADHLRDAQLMATMPAGCSYLRLALSKESLVENLDHKILSSKLAPIRPVRLHISAVTECTALSFHTPKCFFGLF